VSCGDLKTKTTGAGSNVSTTTELSTICFLKFFPAGSVREKERERHRERWNAPAVCVSIARVM